jgi:hypothetical protein
MIKTSIALIDKSFILGYGYEIGGVQVACGSEFLTITPATYDPFLSSDTKSNIQRFLM